MQPRYTHTRPSNRPKASSTPPALSINTGLTSPATCPRSISRTSSCSSPSFYSSLSTSTPVPQDHQRQHRWSELVPPQTALTFVAMYDPSDGLLTFSGASLLPSEPPTPPTPTTPTLDMLDTPDTPKAHARMQIPMPMPCTPAPSTLADMQSLLDVYFRSTSGTTSAAAPARASSTFDGLVCVASPDPMPDYPPPSPSPSAGTGRDKPLPKRPPPPPDRDSVFAWSWLGRMAPDDPREPWNVDSRANTDANGNADGFGCAYWPSTADSGYESETGCDDGDSFYYTPPELEDPNECSAFSVTTTSTSEYIDVPGRDCDSVWSANVLAYAYPASATATTSTCPRAGTRTPARACGRARSHTQPSSPSSPAQALLHPWRLLRSRTSHATIAGAGAGTGSLQRRASRAASVLTKLGRLASRDDSDSWIYVEVVHTITQRPLRDCEW
ncbi:hypothetical protein EDB89DRAFT_212065 [Lactarius sanguifluus]|nr:hypothetical protein EDB89DRAFT_212065 [Lactarius sanguifluus]